MYFKIKDHYVCTKRCTQSLREMKRTHTKKTHKKPTIDKKKEKNTTTKLHVERNTQPIQCITKTEEKKR